MRIENVIKIFLVMIVCCCIVILCMSCSSKSDKIIYSTTYRDVDIWINESTWRNYRGLVALEFDKDCVFVTQYDEDGSVVTSMTYYNVSVEMHDMTEGEIDKYKEETMSVDTSNLSEVSELE